MRRDVRCFWCAKWTPAAKFCRSCGAETVEPRVYGPARMLKDAGTDRFSVPKMLRELDPDQIENFSRIYQRHATAVARHVDELRFLERFLRQKVWSSALEDQLLPQLPWPEETLEKLSAPTPPPADDLPTARTIAETSPFPTTRAVAALVRLRLDDWTAYKDASPVLHASDPTLRAEAALVLTSWRVLTGVGRPRDDGRLIVQELERSPFKLEAAVALGLLGRENKDLLRDALASPDRDVAFGASLVLGDVDRLQAALQGDELQRIAAGHKLISLGVIKAVVEVVEKSSIEVQRELVDGLYRRKGPAPEASDTLLEIAEKTDDEHLRSRAVSVLCRQLKAGWVMRLARAAREDRGIYQSLLQAETLPPDAAVELADFLLDHGRFGSHQYGLSNLAERGTVPDTYVVSRFGDADEKTKTEMLRFAEKQLEKRGNEELHRFVMGIAFGPPPAERRAAAWWVLHRWYRHQGDHRGEGPWTLTKEAVERFFGSIPAFIPRLADVLRDHATLKEVGYFEMIAHLLDSADEAAVEAIQAQGDAADILVDALLEALRQDYWPQTVEGMVKLVSRIGTHPRWQARVLEVLRSAGKRGNYHHDKALRRVELAVHGIPEESEWNDLDPAFVPARWPELGAEGRGELLKLADHLLVHAKDASEGTILPFLLRVAMSRGDAAFRTEAAEIHEDRARGPYEDPRLRRASIERAFGSYGEFVRLLPDVLREPDGPAEKLLKELYSDPTSDGATELAAEGEAGKTVVLAMIERAAVGERTALQYSLYRWLETCGSHPSWRAEAVAALERHDTDGAKRVLRAVRPPAPEPKPVDAEEEEPAAVAENPWVEKQRDAEKLGRELQEAIRRIMAGSGSPDQKMREATRLNQEFQAAIKRLYS